MNNIGSKDWRESAFSVKDRLKYISIHDDEETQQDVVIIAGYGTTESKIIAHSLMLFISSKVFADLLDNAKINNDGIKEIKLPDVHPHALKFILKYIYTDCLDLKDGDAIDILYAALKFNLNHLAAHCISKLIEEMNPENVLRLYEEAFKMGVNELVHTSMDMILKNAADIFQSTKFLCISNESLCTFLKHDDLQINEVSLFTAVMRWGKAECKRCELEENPDNLRYVLKRMVPLIRFVLMSIEDFATVVEPTNILDQIEIVDLYKYFSLKNSNLKAKIQAPEWMISSKPRINITDLSYQMAASNISNPHISESASKASIILRPQGTKKDSLLHYLKRISIRKMTISGIYLTYTKDNRNIGIDAFQKYTGELPGILNTRMPGLFQTDDEWQLFVDETIRNWNNGHLVHIAWWDNALTSMDVNNYTEASDDTKWRDLIEDGGHMNKIWKAQLDYVAKYLHQLQNAGVVCICDLLPNINDKWMYWRGRPGIDGSARLFQFTRNYMTNQGLDSLIWAWSLHVMGDMDKLEEYWPGGNYVDVVPIYMHNQKELPANVNQKLKDLVGNKPISMEYMYSVPTFEMEPISFCWAWFTIYDNCLVRNKLAKADENTYVRKGALLKNAVTSRNVVNKGNIVFFQSL